MVSRSCCCATLRLVYGAALQLLSTQKNTAARPHALLAKFPRGARRPQQSLCCPNPWPKPQDFVLTHRSAAPQGWNGSSEGSRDPLPRCFRGCCELPGMLSQLFGGSGLFGLLDPEPSAAGTSLETWQPRRRSQLSLQKPDGALATTPGGVCPGLLCSKVACTMI